MPYAPGISYSSAGLTEGLDALAGAVLEKANQRRLKEQMAKATEVLQPLIDRLAPGSGVNLSKDTPKEAIPQVIQLAGEVGRMQREAPLKSLQMENEKLRQRISQQELDQAAANASAAGAAAPFLDPNRRTLPSGEAVDAAFKAGAPVPTGQRGPDYVGAISSYLGAKGQDPRMLAQLGDLAQQQMKGSARVQPQLLELAPGVRGVWDGNNFSRVTDPKPAKPTAEPYKIGDKEFFKVGNTIMDAEGRVVKAPGADKPLDPFAAQALYSRYQQVLEQAAPEAKAGIFESKQAAEARTAQLREQANFLAGQLGFAAPFPTAGTAPERPERGGLKAPATPYNHADVKAELKRRGLAK